MAIRVQFEIGHSAKLKSKKTAEGFTHDWDLFVKGTDKSDISHFVEKVVFNLHDSFPKPKRAIKEAPYVLKESGYAGFVLPIDIFFRNRDEPKRVTFNYDLDLQTMGPPVYKSEIKKFIFPNPSDEFRRKLIKGGGILVSNNPDEKSRDSFDEHGQPLLSKPKLSGIVEASKKHNRLRPDETSVPSTFSTVFGTPIKKTSTKVSPDPKSKGSPSLNVATTGGKGGAAVGAGGKGGVDKEKPSSKLLTSSIAKEQSDRKSEKKEKHNKHTNSPQKEKSEGVAGNSKDAKKSDEKYDRREEKKKEKSRDKDRDRSKEKSSKRPLSPKRLPSPKRPSPARSTSTTSRGGDENGYGKHQSSKGGNNHTENNNSEKNSSQSTSKKSKKDKKSHDKERERADAKKDKERDRKDKDERSNSSSSLIAPSILNHSSNQSAKSNSSDMVSKTQESSKIKDKESSSNNITSSKDSKESKKISSSIDGVKSIEQSNNLSGTTDMKKLAEKHEKDVDKKHKHKKKDKNKDKEKEHSSKERKKDKSNKIGNYKDEQKKLSSNQQQLSGLPDKTPPLTSQMPLSQKQAPVTGANPLNTLMNEISDHESSGSDVDSSAVSNAPEKPEINVTESSNSSLHDVIVGKSTLSSATPLPPPQPTEEVTKPEKKDRKVREKVTKSDKDEKKRKRKSKDDADGSSQTRKSVSPAIPVTEPPPSKQTKKDDNIMKNGEKSNSPLVPLPGAVGAQQPPPSLSSALLDDSTAFRTPSASAPVASTSNNNSLQGTNHDRSLTVDYMSELRDLQQKIMTLQDNNELQQVVEMIAATGRFEITSKTFDFDLCALDRNTVQRLQDFFATSCS